MALLRKVKLMHQLGILSLVLLMFTVFVAGFTIYKMASIGTGIEDIAEQDMPLTEVATSVTTHQLEQAIALEKALRYGQVMAAAETAHERYEEAKKAFATFAHEVEIEITRGEKLAEEAAANAHTEEAKKEFEHVLSVLKAIETEHADFDKHGEELFHLIEAGQMTEASQLAETLQAEEEDINHALEELLGELEKFTQAALLEFV